MIISTIQVFECIISGVIVGFSLGLIGGGGSILAIPLLIYFVKVNDPHLAIGTTAFAVGINAFLNVVPHFREGHVLIKEALIFSSMGTFGVLIGVELGILTPGKRLLFLFGILMVVVGLLMFKRKEKSQNTREAPFKRSYGKLVLTAMLTGFLSGYFGIGGGFLIVPSLIYSTGMSIIQAIGTSLFSVGTFGLVTALRYAINGELNIYIAIFYIIGGIFGGWAGAKLATNLPKQFLNKFFASILIALGLYIMYENLAYFF